MPTIDNVIDQARIKQIRAFAGQTAFDYPFPIFAAADLVVNINGIRLPPSAYSVTGVFNDTGGTVTLVSAASANDLVTLYGDTAIERLADYEFRGRFDSERFNNELDRMTINHQELRDLIGRAIRLGIIGEGEPGDFELPQLADQRIDRVLGFDGSGRIELRAVDVLGDPRSLASVMWVLQAIDNAFDDFDGVSVAVWISPAISADYSYDSSGRINQIEEQLAFGPRSSTLTYTVDGLVDSVTTQAAGQTRIETFQYASGRLVGMTT